MTLCSTDDRYADDVHYDGGCIGSDMLQWAASMFAWNARPPDPAIVGDRWREMWLKRMREAPPFIDHWLGHQRRDAYWKQGSVCEDYTDIEAAVYAVGGWADGYTNAIPRLLEGLPGPRKGLIGPWTHAWPQAGPPEPTIGFLQEITRWFDHWLKGIDTGIMAEPMLRAWIQEPLPPAVCLLRDPGSVGGREPVAADLDPSRMSTRSTSAASTSNRGPEVAVPITRHPDGGMGRGFVVSVRRAGRLARRSARDGRHERHLRVRPAGRAVRDPRASPR